MDGRMLDRSRLAVWYQVVDIAKIVRITLRASDGSSHPSRVSQCNAPVTEDEAGIGWRVGLEQ